MNRGLSKCHYWVIDGLDECLNYEALFPLLSRIEVHVPLRIFMTSRSIDRLLGQSKMTIITETISKEDTLGDIGLFLRERGEFVAARDEDDRDALIERIVSKSDGSFLWASLITKELATTYTIQRVEAVLSQVPSQMDSFYDRILTGFQAAPKNQILAIAIFRWTVSAMRPLSIAELKEALILDIGLTVPQMGTVLSSVTGCLVVIGPDSKVQLVHETIRSFLTSPAATLEYAVDEQKEHLRLAEVCLTYLCGDELQRGREQASTALRKSDLANYATTFFSHHLTRATSSTPEPILLLDRFLGTNVLGCIEFVARTGDLSIISDTASNLARFLQLRLPAPYLPDKRREMASTWSNDLVPIVAGFGKNTTSSPASVHMLMPALCPTKSMVQWDLQATTRKLEVVLLCGGYSPAGYTCTTRQRSRNSGPSSTENR